VLHLPPDRVVAIFSACNVVVMLGRILGGFLVDYTSFSGFWWSGAKNCSIAVMALQAAGALALVHAVYVSHSVPLFLFGGFTVVWAYAFTSSMTAVLARHMFAPVNSVFVWGVALGLAGFVSMGSTALVLPQHGPGHGPAGFPVAFAAVLVLCSFGGLISSVLIRRCEPAFEIVIAGQDYVLCEGELGQEAGGLMEGQPLLGRNAMTSMASSDLNDFVKKMSSVRLQSMISDLNNLSTASVSSLGSTRVLLGGVSVPDYEYDLIPKEEVKKG